MRAQNRQSDQSIQHNSTTAQHYNSTLVSTMDFDETRLYYSHQALQSNADSADANLVADNNTNDDDSFDLAAIRRHVREFLRHYRLGVRYVYREKLLRLHRTQKSKLEIDLAHLGEYDAALLGFVLQQPAALLPACEYAAKDALQTLLYEGRNITSNNNDDDEEGPSQELLQNQQEATITPTDEEQITSSSIQILFKGNLKATPLRSIKSEHMNKLLKCPGIVISTSPVKNRALRLTVRCSHCADTKNVYSTEGPFGSVSLPQACSANPNGECGRFPYAVVPDESDFCDQQTLKLQEAPERVPTGEMPRSVLMAVERSLVDVAPPGTRVSVLCIPTLFQMGMDGNKSVYLRVVGMSKDNDAHGEAVTFTPAEEESFQCLAKRADVYDILQRSIAPDISGSYTVDIKKALTCQLFGGCQKKLPDGVRLRGDINVLLLGDPSMAKSQFLKFISKVAPVGIYTSGKGSSAAGLTASVVRNAKGEFYLEGGAMVLADGGIVCIDEFDKMRPNDRVAIHEAMEQQTISIAKAGITTVLNSRSSVLAAANPVFGTYDDMRSASENIDLMTTILSRFDMIFLVRDIREEARDKLICRHVMGVHINSSRIADGGLGHARPMASGADDGGALSYMASCPMPGQDDLGNQGASSSPEAIAQNVLQVATSGQGELDVAAMKKFIQYCKAKCSPRLSETAGEVLTSSYVKIRDDVRRQTIAASGRSGEDTQATIPITVRQLEALVRMSESLAKMRLDDEVQSEDVTEALRLFKVSTMAANSVDGVADATIVSAPNRQEMERTENFLRSRLILGSMVNKQKIIEEASGQGFNAVHVTRALLVMASRGDLLERNQGRLLKRIK
jgi:DNA replication licensing factor MCM5